MKKQIGVAIIGAGMIGGIHQRASRLADGALVGVLDANPEHCARTAERWGTQAYASVEAIMNDPAVEVVHVCTPNALHYGLAKAALEAGKHVICEKPLATQLEDAIELEALARAKGAVATVPFIYRYHPMVREARARIQEGEIGALQLIHGSYLQDWLLGASDTNWRVDTKQGGASRAFADIGSHWCDVVEWVTGQRFTEMVASFATTVAERPANAQATFSAAAEAENAPKVAITTEDAAGALLRTSAGVMATLTISQVSAGRKNRLWFEIDGAQKSVIFDQEQPEQLWLGRRDGMEMLVRDPSRGSAEQRRLAVLPPGHVQGFAQCFEAFVADTYALIRGEAREGVPTFTDGLRSAHIVDAALRSVKSRNWVTI
jgi:predicted dehydrogenase